MSEQDLTDINTQRFIDSIEMIKRGKVLKNKKGYYRVTINDLSQNEGNKTKSKNEMILDY